MSDLDKDIERCKELMKEEHSNWIGMTNQDAIYNVLFNLENYRSGCRKVTYEKEAYIRVCNELKTELETYKKIAEKLAEEVNIKIIKKSCSYPNTKCLFNKERRCSECVLDWARKEVEK